MSPSTLMTAHDAMEWLKKMSTRIKMGKDNYLSVLILIRNLIADRRELQRTVDAQAAEIVRLTTPKVRPPFDNQGNGQWDFPDSQK